MPTPEQYRDLPPLDALRGMRLWNVRGAFAAVYWSITEGAYRTGYALHLGASNALIGVLSAVASWAHVLQMVSPLIIERLSRRKPLCIGAFAVSHCMWVPIAFIPFVIPAELRLWAMIILIGLSAAALALASPALSSWFTDLVPAHVRGRYVGQQHTIIGAVGLAASLAAGRYMDMFPSEREQTGFVSLFIIAVAFSLGAVAVWAFVPEPPMHRSERVQVATFLSLPFRHANFRSLMLFAAARALAVMIAGPFFAVYMLKSLGIPYTQIAIFSAITTVSMIAANPMWGYLSDKFGHKPILRITSFGISLVPLAWVFATKSNYWITLSVIQVWAGTISAGLILSQYNLMLKTAPVQSRSVYIGCYSALASAAAALGAMLGGALAHAFSTLGSLRWFGYPISSLQCVFLISGLCRFAALPLLAWVREEEEVAASVVIRQVRSGRPLMTFWNLLRMARSSDPARKAEAAEALGSTRSMLAVDELIGLLDDSDRDVRRRAARALGEIGDVRGVGPLIEKARDPLADVGEEAVEALGKISTPQSLTVLLALLDDGRPSVRKSAILALGTMGSPEAQRRVEQLLDSERDPAVFLATMHALSRLGSKRALHRLRTVLRRSSSGLVRKQVANYMGTLLGRPGQFYPLLQAQEMRQQELVARVLARARRRLRTRIPGVAQDRRYFRRRLDAALTHFTKSDYGHAIACMRQVASQAMRRLAASKEVGPLFARRYRVGLGDITIKQRVGLVLQTSDRLRINFGFLSGLQHESRRRELHLEEALLGVFAFGQFVDELRRLARESEAALEGVDRYRGDGSEYV